MYTGDFDNGAKAPLKYHRFKDPLNFQITRYFRLKLSKIDPFYAQDFIVRYICVLDLTVLFLYVATGSIKQFNIVKCLSYFIASYFNFL